MNVSLISGMSVPACFDRAAWPLLLVWKLYNMLGLFEKWLGGVCIRHTSGWKTSAAFPVKVHHHHPFVLSMHQSNFHYWISQSMVWLY